MCGEFCQVAIVLPAHGDDAPTDSLFVANRQLCNGRNYPRKEELRVGGEWADMRQALFCNSHVDPCGGNDGLHGLVDLELPWKIDVCGNDMGDFGRVKGNFVFWVLSRLDLGSSIVKEFLADLQAGG